MATKVACTGICKDRKFVVVALMGLWIYFLWLTYSQNCNQSHSVYFNYIVKTHSFYNLR